MSIGGQEQSKTFLDAYRRGLTTWCVATRRRVTPRTQRGTRLDDVMAVREIKLTTTSRLSVPGIVPRNTCVVRVEVKRSLVRTCGEGGVRCYRRIESRGGGATAMRCNPHWAADHFADYVMCRENANIMVDVSGDQCGYVGVVSM